MSNFEVVNITGNPSTIDYMRNKVDGRAMKALALERISTLQSLAATGIAKPATVLNFNPVPLRLEGGIEGKIPSVIDTAVGPNAPTRLEFQYKGRTHKCTAVTIRDPHLFPWITDVTRKETDDMADGVGVFRMAVCKQIEIAYDYWQAYNDGTPDSSPMGGVVIFEGDIHALKDTRIAVPEFVRLVKGEREFFCKPHLFSEKLAAALDRQREYFNRQIQIGQSYWNDPDQRKNIDNVYLIWAQFGLDMGWREKPVEWQLTVDDPDDCCEGCGAIKKRKTAYFCHACHRPYDPFKCYMDRELGIENVHVRERCTDEQWALVVAEHERRMKSRPMPTLIATSVPLPPAEGKKGKEPSTS